MAPYIKPVDVRFTFGHILNHHVHTAHFILKFSSIFTITVTSGVHFLVSMLFRCTSLSGVRHIDDSFYEIFLRSFEEPHK